MSLIDGEGVGDRNKAGEGWNFQKFLISGEGRRVGIKGKQCGIFVTF